MFGGDPEPIKLKPEERTKANTVYDQWGLSIDAYEQSVQVSNFTSKFDAFLKDNYTMTSDEMAGFNLFNGKGNCNSCHVDGRGTTLQPGQVDTSTTATANPPLFTCFGSANEGLPLNPRNAFYYQTTPDSSGFIGNPYGFGYRDLGMGTFLRSGFGSAPNPNRNWIQFAPAVDGQFQVPTVRNVAMTPSQCPTTEAPRPLLPEGVLSQRLHQELEAARAFLQHARHQLCLPGHFWTLPGRNNREGNLLADERGPAKSRHDDRDARLDR